MRLVKTLDDSYNGAAYSRPEWRDLQVPPDKRICRSMLGFVSVEGFGDKFPESQLI